MLDTNAEASRTCGDDERRSNKAEIVVAFAILVVMHAVVLNKERAEMCM